MALGASGPSVVRQFIGRGLRLGAIGAAAGVVAALGVNRLLTSVLFGVSATDAISFARALALVLIVVMEERCTARAGRSSDPTRVFVTVVYWLWRLRHKRISRSVVGVSAPEAI